MDERKELLKSYIDNYCNNKSMFVYDKNTFGDDMRSCLNIWFTKCKIRNELC